jgi:hypothetical protein
MCHFIDIRIHLIKKGEKIMNKGLVQHKNKYYCANYYEDLIHRYNPDNVFISIINVDSKQKFKEEIVKAIAKLLQQSDADIVDELAEQIEGYWEGQGKYIVNISDYGFFDGVVINSERLSQ